MFLAVRFRVALAMLIAAALAPQAALAAGAGKPTPAQIRTAVARAERSSAIWATVNICNTKRHPNVVGIRGQLPALGFKAQLTMQVDIKFWSYKDNRFESVPGAKQVISLGDPRRGLQQGGLSFQFAPHAGFLASTVRFDWKLHRRSVGHTFRWTSSGHADADGGDPPRFSAWKCVIS